MQTTLFPDYFALDETCCLHRAEIVMEKLAEIPLIFLDNQQERNTVLKRLSEAGVNTLAELLILPRFDVAEWDGVGRFFLHIFDEMRQEVRNNPEQLIEQWLLQRATWTFPITPEPDNPWSLQHYVSPAPYIASTTAENSYERMGLFDSTGGTNLYAHRPIAQTSSTHASGGVAPLFAPRSFG